MDLNRRIFCGAIAGTLVSALSDRFENRDLIVHRHLQPWQRGYRVGEVFYDHGCGRHLRIVKIIETPTGPLAKTRWVSRIVAL